MLMRWMRKMLVLALAALGVQYLRMIAGVVLAELRPRTVPPVPRAPRPTNGAGAARSNLVPQRLVITTLEPHGAL